MMGKNIHHQRVKCLDPVKFINEINTFPARFDDTDFRNEWGDLCQSLDPLPVTMCEDDVVSVLSHVKPRKAPGSDSLKGKVLKVCATQLGSVFIRLFQLLLDTQFVPCLWRLSTIILVPNKPNATLMKHFRLVSLTSVLCKCMDRIVHCQPTTSVAGRMNPLQIAYRAGGGVEDATLTLLDTVSKHLDSTGNFVRILFMDFSSASNTIQPQLMDQSVSV